MAIVYRGADRRQHALPTTRVRHSDLSGHYNPDQTCRSLFGEPVGTSKTTLKVIWALMVLTTWARVKLVLFKLAVLQREIARLKEENEISKKKGGVLRV